MRPSLPFLPSTFALCAAVLLPATLLTAGTATYRNAILTDAPIAYWEMDETAGAATAADAAGTPQNGTYQSVTLGQASAFPNLGTCGQFNGSTSRVAIAANAAFELGTGDFSVELWAKTPVTARGDAFNYKNANDFGIFLNQSGTGSIGGWHNGGLPSWTGTVNEWYHIVFTRSSGTIRLYVNGVERGSAADAQSFSANAQMFIGANHSGAPAYTPAIPFNGWIDEVAVYGSALSSARVLDHFNAAQAAPVGSPSVTNTAAVNITSSGARLGGTVTDPGSSPPTVTIYYGDNDAGASLTGWDANVSAGLQTGTFAVDVSGLAANTTHYFRCYAQNPSGGNWAPSSLSFTTPAGPPGVVNAAATSILATSATAGATVTSTGGSTTTVTLYYGTTDAGTSAGAWQASVPLGAQTGTVTTSLAGLTPGTTYYFRAAATNSSGTAWAPATASFATPLPSLPSVNNLPATAVSIFWATLNGQVTSSGNDTPDTTIFWGPSDGGTNPAAWANEAPLGLQTGNFSKLVTPLTPSTTYYYRARAVNVAGTAWAASTATFSTPATASLEVVINEIHCDHEDATLRMEFIELYNPGPQALNLAGWYFDSGISYSFPANASIPAGGYAVVTENPAVLQTTYGYAGAYGPWTGSLQANGERIVLRNPAGDIADEVDYGMGFPWPTVGTAPNYSHELINPALDNDLGGHWRSKASAVSGTDPELLLVSPASTAWRMRRGNKPAPAADWIQPTYAEDPGNWEAATTTYDSATGYYKGIGYGDNDDATVLSDMINTYRSVYLRQTFTVPAGEIRGNLRLRVYADDAAVVYLNGVEVPQRFSVSVGTVGHNGTGVTVSGHEAAPNVWRELSISNMSAWIVAGENTIAVHGLNETIGSSDFSLNVELRRVPGAAGGSPTPGAQNSVFATNAPPALRQVEHYAALPVPGQTTIHPGQDVVVTAKATDPDGVQSVSLLYQIVEPGTYITKEDAAYELAANWTTLAMNDAGTGQDLLAGDGIYTAVIPGTVQTHRRLIRYRIQAMDTPGASVRVPYADDPAPNFAYFVYGTMPDYTGAINPTGAASYTGSVIPSHTSNPAAYPATMLQQIPTYHLITTRQNHVDAQYIPGPPNATNPTTQYRGDESGTATDEQAYPWRGTLVYDGKVYDHVRYRARGGVWRYSMGKNMWKFDMMRGHDFQAKDNRGIERQEKWKKLNFSSCIQQGDFSHRGEQGLFESVGFRLFQRTGMPANHTNYVHFRIIEHASESGPTSGQYDDDFQGLYLAVEQEDGQFLKEHGLPDGNLYKMEGGTGELNNQGPDMPKNKSDLNAFIAYSTLESWWRGNVVLPNYYNYRAIIDCIHHYDIGDGKNYFYFHYPVNPQDPNSDKWQPAVWDLDLTWADNMYRGDAGIAGLAPSGNTTEPFFSRVWAILPLRTEMRNRHREVLDLLWNAEQTGMLIDEQASFIYQPGVPSFTGADRAMWDYNPIMVSSFVNASKAGRGRYYQSAVDDPATTAVNEALTFPGMMQKMKNYILTRRNVITAEILGDESAIPLTPAVTRAGGATTFPTNDLSFTCSAYSSPSGRPFSKMKWRIAEITDPNAPTYNRWDRTTPRKYEMDPDNTWESPEITTFSSSFTFPAQTARPGSTYRVRVKFADAGDAANGNTPRWSHWSAPVTFTAAAPDVTAYLNSLVIAEIMYHPREPSGAEINASANNEEFEYITILNAGAATLDLANIRFTKGIDFDFSTGSIAALAPGERAIVVRNLAAFTARYGATAAARIAGVWETGDSLANGGEEIKLSFGSGTAVREFTYDDNAPWPAAADGDGYPLVLVAPWTIPDHSQPQNWRAGKSFDGAPNVYDGERFAAWLTANSQTGPLDDSDEDGLQNLLEYALGTSPAEAVRSALPVASVELADTIEGPQPFLTITGTFRRDADDVLLIPERSTDLSAWDGSSDEIVPVSSQDQPGGLTQRKWRSAHPWNAARREYLRVRIQQRP